MRYHYPVYYKKFQCIGARCPETCCQGWQIAIDEKSCRKYQRAVDLGHPFGQRLKEGIEFKEGCFRTKERFCSFLNENRLCDIYIEMGSKALCRTCRIYPRHMEDYGKLQEWGLSLSCPEAARLLLEMEEKQTFTAVKRPEKSGSMEGISSGLLKKLILARKKILHLLQDRTLPLSVRAAVILDFSHEIQKYLDEGRNRQLEELLEGYDFKKAVQESERQLNRESTKDQERFLYMKNYMAMFQELEVVIERWPGFIKDCMEVLYHPGSSHEQWRRKKEEFLSQSVTDDIAGEQLLVYFIYTYFLGAVYDKQPEAKVKLAVLSWLMIREAAMAGFLKKGAADKKDLVEAAYLYSREVEHSDHNLEVLEQILNSHPMFSMEKFLLLLAG